MAEQISHHLVRNNANIEISNNWYRNELEKDRFSWIQLGILESYSGLSVFLNPATKTIHENDRVSLGERLAGYPSLSGIIRLIRRHIYHIWA